MQPYTHIFTNTHDRSYSTHNGQQFSFDLDLLALRDFEFSHCSIEWLYFTLLLHFNMAFWMFFYIYISCMWSTSGCVCLCRFWGYFYVPLIFFRETKVFCFLVLFLFLLCEYHKCMYLCCYVFRNILLFFCWTFTFFLYIIFVSVLCSLFYVTFVFHSLTFNKTHTYTHVTAGISIDLLIYIHVGVRCSVYVFFFCCFFMLS